MSEATTQPCGERRLIGTKQPDAYYRGDLEYSPYGATRIALLDSL
ncbi:hypothetical protein ACDY96_04890 [Rhizobium mongolense]|nr:hypothetical protein [Rhizobium sp. CC1099]WFU87616.1 hypothetical protein QA644_00455 [Rhizobium sp. CC1099]